MPVVAATGELVGRAEELAAINDVVSAGTTFSRSPAIPGSARLGCSLS